MLADDQVVAEGSGAVGVARRCAPAGCRSETA
jgi:hypothetical protein